MTEKTTADPSLHEPRFCVVRSVQDDIACRRSLRQSVLRTLIVKPLCAVILRSPRRPKDLRLFLPVHAIQSATGSILANSAQKERYQMTRLTQCLLAALAAYLLLFGPVVPMMMRMVFPSRLGSFWNLAPKANDKIASLSASEPVMSGKDCLSLCSTEPGSISNFLGNVSMGRLSGGERSIHLLNIATPSNELSRRSSVACHPNLLRA